MTDASASPTPNGLGSMLRTARERAGMTLEDVARLTSVRTSYLEALEAENLDDLPEDVYARNFVRLYARAVHVDANDALAAFSALRAARNPAPLAEEPTPPRSTPTPQPPRSTPSTPNANPPTRTPDAPSNSNDAGATPAPRTGPTAPVTQRAPTPMAGRVRPAPTPPIGGRDLRRALLDLTPLLMTIVVAGTLIGVAVWGFNRLLDRPTNPVTATTTPNETETTPEAALTAPDGDETASPTLLAEDVFLTVTSDPPGAEVTVDAFALPGITPITDAPVSARAERTVRVELEGFLPYEAVLDLTRDRDLLVTLEPIPGTPTTDTPEGEENAVVVNVRETTWLEAYQSTARGVGERLVYTTAQPGERFVFERPVYLHLGNAGGIEVTVDGEAIPPLGSSGAVLGRAFPAPAAP